jgi:hypothetical protein
LLEREKHVSSGVLVQEHVVESCIKIGFERNEGTVDCVEALLMVIAYKLFEIGSVGVLKIVISWNSSVDGDWGWRRGLQVLVWKAEIEDSSGLGIVDDPC